MPANVDFIEDLLQRNLQDLKQRMRTGRFGRASASALLRKCTRLEDMDLMIQDMTEKADNLLSNAEKEA